MFNTDQDVFDSREVIKHIEELEALRDANELTKEDAAELEMLTAFADEGSDALEDWECGVTLIHENYFVAYTKDLVTDTKSIPKDLPSFIEIGWDATADNMKEYYTEVTLDGNTYYAR